MAPPKSKIPVNASVFLKKIPKCNTCSRILKSSGNTTDLVAHLRQKYYENVKTTIMLSAINISYLKDSIQLLNPLEKNDHLNT